MANKFSNKNMGAQSLRSKGKAIAERLTELEDNFARTLIGVDEKFNNVASALNEINEVLEVIVEELGKDRVDDLLKAKRLVRSQAQAAAEQKSLESAIEDGYVSSSEVITPDSLLVGEEVLPDGSLLNTGRQQVIYTKLAPRFQEILLGKQVGEVVKTPAGGTFTVKEIYHVDVEKARLVLTAKAQKMADEAQAKAQAVAEKDEEEDKE